MRFEPGVGGRFSRSTTRKESASSSGGCASGSRRQRLVFDWRSRNFAPGQVTEVEIRFEPDAGGTRITLEHRGWGAFPPEHPVRHGLEGQAFSSMMGVWWADLLTSARAHAKGA